MTIEIGSRMAVYVTVKNHKTTKTGSVCWVECEDLSPRYDTPLEMPEGEWEDVLLKAMAYWVEIEALAQKDNQDGSQPWQYKWSFIRIVDEPDVEDDQPAQGPSPQPFSAMNVAGDLDRFREQGINRRKALEEANKRYASQPPTVSTDEEITATAQAFLEFLEG